MNLTPPPYPNSEISSLGWFETQELIKATVLLEVDLTDKQPLLTRHVAMHGAHCTLGKSIHASKNIQTPHKNNALDQATIN